MTAAQVIIYAVQASVFLLVLSLGLKSRPEDVAYLFRHPGVFVRSILAMNVVMLVFVIAAIHIFDLPAPIRIALIALAVSPVPPILPTKQVKAGGSGDYAIGLLFALALSAIVLIPLFTWLIRLAFGINIQIPAPRVATIVMISSLIPLLVGVCVRRLSPAFAVRIAHPLSLVAIALIVVGIVPILFIATPALMTLIGNGVLVSLIVFSLVGLAVGHLLGGPDADDRTVLALATAARHPGMAFAIASVPFPGDKAVMAVVLYHVIIGTIVALPYVKWRTRLHEGAAASPTV